MTSKEELQISFPLYLCLPKADKITINEISSPFLKYQVGFLKYQVHFRNTKSILQTPSPFYKYQVHCTNIKSIFIHFHFGKWNFPYKEIVKMELIFACVQNNVKHNTNSNMLIRWSCFQWMHDYVVIYSTNV
jgi:hypothetical protein